MLSPFYKVSVEHKTTDDPPTGSFVGLILIGYHDDPSIAGDSYFIVKKQLGYGIGESGYFNIAYSQTGAPVYFGEWTIAYHPAIVLPASPTGL